jgi:hypothetical protein
VTEVLKSKGHRQREQQQRHRVGQADAVMVVV